MEGFVCLLVVAGIVGVFVWQFIETRRALETTIVHTALEPRQAAQVIQDAFAGARALLWTTTSGPGDINMRRRGVRGGITMSIDIAPHPGGAQVSMRATETVVYLGVLVNFAGVVNRRKSAIERQLEPGVLTPRES